MMLFCIVSTYRSQRIVPSLYSGLNINIIKLREDKILEIFAIIYFSLFDSRLRSVFCVYFVWVWNLVLYTKGRTKAWRGT